MHRLPGLFVLALSVVILMFLAGCGSNPLTGPTETTRGDDPVRGTNIINYCETTNTKSTSTVVTNTNNCTKQNTTNPTPQEAS